MSRHLNMLFCLFWILNKSFEAVEKWWIPFYAAISNVLLF